MKLADLTLQTREKLKALRFDRIYEKHEGPWQWSYWLEDDQLEFIEMSNFDVLLPIEQEYHPKITPLRVIPSADGQTLTIFFKDTTFSDDKFDSGFIAICEKFPSENFFVAIVYHEWFIVENELFREV